jgi:hypothetical protein
MSSLHQTLSDTGSAGPVPQAPLMSMANNLENGSSALAAAPLSPRAFNAQRAHLLAGSLSEAALSPGRADAAGAGADRSQTSPPATVAGISYPPMAPRYRAALAAQAPPAIDAQFDQKETVPAVADLDCVSVDAPHNTRKPVAIKQVPLGRGGSANGSGSAGKKASTKRLPAMNERLQKRTFEAGAAIGRLSDSGCEKGPNADQLLSPAARTSSPVNVSKVHPNLATASQPPSGQPTAAIDDGSGSGKAQLVQAKAVKADKLPYVHAQNSAEPRASTVLPPDLASNKNTHISPSADKASRIAPSGAEPATATSGTSLHPPGMCMTPTERGAVAEMLEGRQRDAVEPQLPPMAAASTGPLPSAAAGLFRQTRKPQKPCAASGTLASSAANSVSSLSNHSLTPRTSLPQNHKRSYGRSPREILLAGPCSPAPAQPLQSPGRSPTLSPRQLSGHHVMSAWRHALPFSGASTGPLQRSLNHYMCANSNTLPTNKRFVGLSPRFSTDSALHRLELLDSGLMKLAGQDQAPNGKPPSAHDKTADEDAESVLSEDSHISAGLVTRRRVGFLSASKDSWLQQFFNRYMLPTIFHPWGKAVVIIVALIVFILGAIGASRVGEGLQYGELSPDGHFLKPFDDRSSLFQEKVGVFLLLVCLTFLTCCN